MMGLYSSELLPVSRVQDDVVGIKMPIVGEEYGLFIACPFRLLDAVSLLLTTSQRTTCPLLPGFRLGDHPR